MNIFHTCNSTIKTLAVGTHCPECGLHMTTFELEQARVQSAMLALAASGEWIAVPPAAKRQGCSRHRLLAAIHSKRLPALHIGGTYLVNAAALDGWIGLTRGKGKRGRKPNRDKNKISA